MWFHFVNLLFASWSKVLVALGTTTLSVVLFSLVVPVVTFVITMLVVWRTEGGIVDHLRKSAIPTLIGLLVPIAFISFVFLWSTIRAVYDDHQHLVTRANVPKPKCLTCPTCTTCSPLITTTRSRSVPTPEEFKIYNTGVPSRFQDAPEGRALFITTNHAVDTPFQVTVKCQVPILRGGSDFWAAEEGNFIKQKSDQINDGTFESMVSAPRLTPSIAMIVTVYAKTRLGHCSAEVN